MKNSLGFLGFVGFVGILGIITDNRSFLGFFGYFVFFRYFRVKPDELFRQNLRRAATPAFFAGLVTQVLAIGTSAFVHTAAPATIGLVASFIVSVLIFLITLIVLELKEQTGR